MVYIPAGWFWMGCSPNDNQCKDNEKPYHKVYLDAYYIDRNDVTVDEYNKCVNAGVCPAVTYYDCYITPPTRWQFEHEDKAYQKGDHPQVCVNWDEANAYCKWAGKELPTEAQWEKAARGTDGRIYPWGNDWDEGKACHHSEGSTCAVGSYPQGASPYGVMDMGGNVWNWCRDWYDANYYANSPDHNPPGPDSGQYRVVRGVSWGNNVSPDFILRTSFRDYAKPFLKGDHGFRCIRQVSK
jgi:formylglycine-generating enzyme required for sulfatase activity